MILELAIKVVVSVPAEAVTGGATREVLVETATRLAEERLKGVFTGCGTDVTVKATLDGQAYPKG